MVKNYFEGNAKIMKARSRNQKLAIKRGRPKLAASMNSREPNGRPSRRKERTVLLEMDAMNTVAATRIRHMGLKGEDAFNLAIDPRRGYLLGRIFLDGTISHRQHEAGLRYAEDMARYYGLTGTPFPSPRAQDLFAVRGSGGEDSASKGERAREARQKMNALRGALLACGDINTGRKVEHTVKLVCVEDIDERRELNPPMKAWLVRGLNSLAAVYGI